MLEQETLPYKNKYLFTHAPHRTTRADTILFVTSQRTTHQICNIVEKQNSRNPKQPTCTKREEEKKTTQQHQSPKSTRESSFTPDLNSKMQIFFFSPVTSTHRHETIMINSSCVSVCVRARARVYSLPMNKEPFDFVVSFFPNSENYWKINDLFFTFHFIVYSNKFLICNMYIAVCVFLFFIVSQFLLES